MPVSPEFTVVDRFPVRAPPILIYIKSIRRHINAFGTSQAFHKESSRPGLRNVRIPDRIEARHVPSVWRESPLGNSRYVVWLVSSACLFFEPVCSRRKSCYFSRLSLSFSTLFEVVGQIFLLDRYSSQNCIGNGNRLPRRKIAVV